MIISRVKSLRIITAIATAIFFTLFDSAVYAHTGTGTAIGGGFNSGFTHPLLGLDHLLAMLAVGIWSVQAGGKFVWLAPLTFMAMMMVGGALGMSNLGIPVFEIGIMGSVVIFGLAIAAAWNPAPVIGMALCGLFAIFHGHAHGTEMEITASPILYGLGFIASTGMLHLSGIVFAKSMRRFEMGMALRWVGAGITTAGVALFLV